MNHRTETRSSLLVVGMCWLLAAAVVALSGCSTVAGWSPVEKFSETNQMIADSNNNRLAAFASGIAACGDNAACQVGISMAFAGNLGQQQFMRPETALDYLKALYPWVDMGFRVYERTQGEGGNATGFVLNHSSGNTFIGVANKNSADRGSSLSTEQDTNISPTTITQSGETGTAAQSGTMPASEPVIVEPSYPPVTP